MAFGGGGVVVSGGFFARLEDALERCYDAAPWGQVGCGGLGWRLSGCGLDAPRRTHAREKREKRKERREVEICQGKKGLGKRTGKDK